MKRAFIGFGLVAILCGCPTGTDVGKLTVRNDSTRDLTDVFATNHSSEHRITFAEFTDGDAIHPGEERTFVVEVEGWYKVEAQARERRSAQGSTWIATLQTWVYGDDVYFGPGVRVTWTLTDEGKDNELVYTDELLQETEGEN